MYNLRHYEYPLPECGVFVVIDESMNHCLFDLDSS